ncbi:ABC transporter substrate-binding protein [Brevibacillus ginsengisoli]|uniref:ABC transporter substrate-binding protein n=1 Tax=Brevibacillus ginsengisoli TaxID=363854 RepID=UPI003CF56C0E
MKKKQMLGTALTGAITASMIVTGCSSQPASKPADNAAQTQPTTTDANKGGKTLIFARGGDAVTLDAIAATDGESFRVTDNILETLVNYKPGSTEVVPGLAEKWEVTPDGKTYTFHLRQGVKFTDGTDFDAEAVVFNFERWMDPSNPLHLKDQFSYFSDMFGGFKGSKDLVIESVKAVDKQTVEFKLTHAQAPFINNLGMTCFGIASPKALKEEKEKFGEHPVGTGPFIFKEWKREDTITVEKNPNYWQQGLPKLDKVIFKVIPDNTARLTALKSGEVDIIEGFNPDDVQSVKDSPDLQLILRPSMNVGYLGFNNEKKPFDNPKVREALGHAINKPALIQAFYGGLAQPATNMLAPKVWGYNDSITDRDYNLDKAKQLLAEAGYPNGFEVEFMAMPVSRPYMPSAQKTAEAIQQDFNKIGVKTKIITFEWATYLSKLKKGESQMFLIGWTGDNGDPDNFLATLLDKNTIGSNNYTRYASEDVHKLLMAAQTETDQAKRTELYKKAQELIFKDAPAIPLVHSNQAIAASKKVSGFVPSPTGTESMDVVDMQ